MSGTSTGRQRLARTLGRRGLIAALITGGGVFAVLLAQSLVSAIVSSIDLRGVADLGVLWTGVLERSLSADLPFAIGVVVSLWQILPIAPELRFAHVVTRSLVAAAVGALAVLVVMTVLLVVALGTSSGFDGLGTAASELSHGIGVGLVQVLRQAVLAWVGIVPIVVLGGLLLCGWLQRFPPKHAVTGVVDEL